MIFKIIIISSPLSWTLVSTAAFSAADFFSLGMFVVLAATKEELPVLAIFAPLGREDALYPSWSGGELSMIILLVSSKELLLQWPEIWGEWSSWDVLLLKKMGKKGLSFSLSLKSSLPDHAIEKKDSSIFSLLLKFSPRSACPGQLWIIPRCPFLRWVRTRINIGWNLGWDQN